MVLHHVAHDAGMVVVAAAQFDPEFLGHGDLHVFDIPAIPDGLEDAVAKPENHDVLHGLLPEVVINAVDLPFGDVRGQIGVQFPRAGQIVTERLLDDDPPPRSRRFGGQPDDVQLLDDLGEKAGGDSEVEEDIAREVPGFLHVGDLGRKVFESLGIVEVARDVIAAPGEVFPVLVIHRAGGELLDVGGDFRAVQLIVAVAHGHADDGEVFRHELEGLEIVKGREEFAFGQVAGGPEDDDRAGISGTFVAGERLVRHGWICSYRNPRVSQNQIRREG